MRSPDFVKFVESEMIGVAYPAINDGSLKQGLVPLPPITEQHRIVARVNELMALCDGLEAQLAKAQGHGQSLLGSLVHHVVGLPVK